MFPSPNSISWPSCRSFAHSPQCYGSRISHGQQQGVLPNNHNKAHLSPPLHTYKRAKRALLEKILESVCAPLSHQSINTDTISSTNPIPSPTRSDPTPPPLLPQSRPPPLDNSPRMASISGRPATDQRARARATVQCHGSCLRDITTG